MIQKQWAAAINIVNSLWKKAKTNIMRKSEMNNMLHMVSLSQTDNFKSLGDYYVKH